MRARGFLIIPALLCSIASAMGQEVQITEEQKARTQAVWSNLMDDIGPYRNSLESWAVEYDSTRFYSQNRVMPTTAEEFKKLLNDLVEIEKIIQSPKYNGVIGYFGRSDDIIHRPQFWTEVTSKRVEITQKVLQCELGRILKPQIMTIEGMTQSVRDFDGWGLSESGLQIALGNRKKAQATVLAKSAGLAAAVGLKLEDLSVAEFEKACNDLVAAVKTAAATTKPSATYTMATVGDALKKRWAAGSWANRKIEWVRTELPTWKVTKNALGTPLYRTVAVVVRFRLQDVTQPIEYSTQVRENYIGGGKYKFATTVMEADYRVVR
ncbi:MAG TPA: hypothetical protein VK171_03260 [Fimbriimonas sp.]|nr:hypothetical protein [Fimbriimonas sp.]